MSDSAGGTPAPSPLKKKSNKKWLIVGVAVVIVVALIATAVLGGFIGGSSSEKYGLEKIKSQGKIIMEEGGGASTLDQQDRGLQAAEPFGVLAGYERSDVAQEGPAVLDPQRPLRQTPWVHTGRGYPDHPDELIQLVLADIAPGLLARSPQRLETRIIGRMVQSPERRRIDQREGPDPVRLVQGITEGGAAPKDHATMSNGPLGTASSRVAFRAPASVRSE